MCKFTKKTHLIVKWRMNTIWKYLYKISAICELHPTITKHDTVIMLFICSYYIFVLFFYIYTINYMFSINKKIIRILI